MAKAKSCFPGFWNIFFGMKKSYLSPALGNHIWNRKTDGFKQKYRSNTYSPHTPNCIQQ